MSLINDALKRVDAEKGPRRPAPLGPPPPPASPGKAALAPPLAPAAALPREAGRWRILQAAVLGAALVIVIVAGIVIWKMAGDSPAQLAAAPATPAGRSPAAGGGPSAALSPIVAAASSAAQKQIAPEPPSRAAAHAAAPENSSASLVLRLAGAKQGPKAEDSLPAAANLTDTVKDVFASPPTLFMDARKSQDPAAPAGGDLPLTPAESRLATIDAVSPVRLATAFAAPAAPAAGSPRPAAPVGAPPASAPAAPPPPIAAPAAETPKLKVTSIFYNARAPTAIINGQVIGVGDTIDGATVRSIAPRSIEVEFGGRRLTLRL
jgi:hypothetical protein